MAAGALESGEMGGAGAEELLEAFQTFDPGLTGSISLGDLTDLLTKVIIFILMLQVRTR